MLLPVDFWCVQMKCVYSLHVANGLSFFSLRSAFRLGLKWAESSLLPRPSNVSELQPAVLQVPGARDLCLQEGWTVRRGLGRMSPSVGEEGGGWWGTRKLSGGLQSLRVGCGWWRGWGGERDVWAWVCVYVCVSMCVCMWVYMRGKGKWWVSGCVK